MLQLPFSNGYVNKFWTKTNNYEETLIKLRLTWSFTMRGFHPLHDSLITWSCQITWQTENTISSLPEWLWPPNLAERWLTLRVTLHKVTRPFDYMVLQCHVTNKNHYISTTTVSTTITLGRVVTCFEGLRSIKSRAFQVKWSCNMTRQTKTIVFSLPQCMWSLNVAGRWLNMGGFYPWSHMTLWSPRMVTYLEGPLSIK